MRLELRSNAFAFRGCHLGCVMNLNSKRNYKTLTWALGALLLVVLIGGGALYAQKAREARTNAASLDAARKELQTVKAAAQ
jgi:hypothetical protein